MLVRNWEIKLLALLLAFLFWYMIKVQIASSFQRTFTEDHSLKGTSGL
jgi:YbbR domain-containing protein